MGVPLWVLWIVSAIAVTWRGEWQRNQRWGRCAVFGIAWEFPSNQTAVGSHTDRWTNDTHESCSCYPIATLYYRIRLWPPSFIDRPSVDAFNDFSCHRAAFRKVKPSGVLPVKREGERFEVMEGGGSCE